MIAAMATAFSNMIDGRPVESTDRTSDINPSNVQDIVGEFARGTPADVEHAIASARQAFKKWSLSKPQERFDILDRAGTEILARKDELGRLLAREQGKPLADAMGEAGRAGAIFKFFAGEAVRIRGDKLDSVRPGVEVEVTREPVGVVGRITPWNFPLAIPAWKIAPALAFGNCVVFKPAELVPASPWALVDILQRAGLPAGVLNLVMGPGSKIGPAIASSPDIDAVSFTGSQDVGVGRRRRGQERRARAARDGRQESAHRARRRRSGDGGVGRGQRRVLPDRAALHGVEPPHRHRGHSRSVHRRRWSSA